MGYPTPDQRARSKWKSKPVQLAIGDASSALSEPLAEGTYWVHADVECWWLQGDELATADTDCHHLPAGTFVELHVEAADVASRYVAAVTAEGVTGVLQISRMED